MASYEGYAKKVTIGGTPIPEMTSNFKAEANVVEDTNSETSGGFKTKLPGLINASGSMSGKVSAAIGYATTVKKGGTSTAMTGEAMELVAGKTYKITAAVKQVIDEAEAITVLDGVTDVTAEVLSYDYLFGKITFKDTYTVVGAITITANYIPLAVIAGGRSFSLDFSADTMDATDYATALANGGWRVNKIGLFDAKATVGRLADMAATYLDILTGRESFLLDIVTAGGLLTTRGWFNLVGLEEGASMNDMFMEPLSFELRGRNTQNFSYSAGATFNAGLAALLTAFFGRTPEAVQLLVDGVDGFEGQALFSGFGISGDLEGVDDFTASFVAGGAWDVTA